MSYIRTKKIDNKFYCYLVENKWTKKGPRQKVKKYLGRLHNLPKLLDHDFYSLFPDTDYSRMTKSEILSTLAVIELTNHGFNKEKNLFIHQDLTFCPKTLKFQKTKRSILLNLNEGHLSTFTLKRILQFKKTGDFNKDAHTLAKNFVEAGINIPQELFIEFYKKRK
ncbi:hypothetical protein HOC13_01215 [Candidatus Woesearchaeota archaeon]|nr:hypothetical protein [Candidatus Woesearchaeota archaeon]